jgi:hypothetical protein
MFELAFGLTIGVTFFHLPFEGSFLTLFGFATIYLIGSTWYRTVLINHYRKSAAGYVSGLLFYADIYFNEWNFYPSR